MQTLLQEQASGQLALVVNGDLDQVSLTQDYWQLASAADKQKIINAKTLCLCLAAVERADTAGLAWILNLTRDVKQHKVTLCIRNASKKLLDLAALSGVSALLNIETPDSEQSSPSN